MASSSSEEKSPAPSIFGRECVNALPSYGRAVESFGGDYVAISGGDVGELAREIDGWRAAGGTHVSIVTMGLGLDSLDAHVDYIASLADILGLSS